MTDQTKIGLWKYKDKLPPVSQSCMLSMGEGDTSYKTVDGIRFKCEYENPTGSMKDRGIVYQLAKAKEKGFDTAVISSSGNAAISAANYSKLFGIKLHIFVSQKINPEKLKVLQKLNENIHISAKPVSSAYKFALGIHAYNLRQSTDEYATFGYRTIAYELLEEEASGIDAIFIPVSSGTTMVGIYEGFRDSGGNPSFHLVQTEAVHPIASRYDKDFEEKEDSLSDAIVAKFTKREETLHKIIKESKGSGWVIGDEEMKKNIGWLHKHGMLCSYEGAAVLSAYQKAIKKGFQYKHPVCLLTGKFYP